MMIQPPVTIPAGRILGLLLFLVVWNTPIRAQDTGEDQLGAWYMYFGTNRVSDKWSIHSEAQFRFYDLASNFNQLLLRSRGSSTPMAYARLLWDLKIKKNIDTARLVILGIKKSARGGPLSGLSVLLYVKTHVIGKSLGYRMAELGWTLEDNAKINMGIEIMGGKRYKTYRVYDRDLA